MKLFFFLCFLYFVLTFSAYSQEIDTQTLRCQYKLTYVKDSTNMGKTSEDLMILELGRKCSKFYSYYTFHSDSLVDADTKAGVSVMEMIGNMAKYGGKRSSYTVYRDYPEGDVTVVDKIIDSHYCYAEPIVLPQWQVKAEYDTILGYRCQMAVCNFKGRSYVAWFAPGIPVNGGPWQLSGLPGLILKVADTRNHYTFQCVGLKASSLPIVFNKVELTKVSKKEYSKVVRRYYADAIGLIESTFGATITPLDGGGKPSKPYNPIDLTL
ncbi:GLPGLI family protein [Williamwhitmania taraxaci]|uniref:GLPGLI family protein n=1 Tax=Williamwhitmania taraxaci TaxID=1640674 RepID=A0A1G6JCE4_9BACT|nr:GLPGLI family protein [Williamwhitmania taraxaci]SDC16065.1 GLPGLI family protein [Williamwhitmania taraxaci]